MAQAIEQVRRFCLPQWAGVNGLFVRQAQSATAMLLLVAAVLLGQLILQRPACAQPVTEIVSDTQTEYSVDGASWSPAVLAWVHPEWPKLTNASWVWKSEYVTADEAMNGSVIVSFRRKFVLPANSSATLADIEVAADNAYDLSLNGKLLGKNGTLDANSNDDGGFKIVGHYYAMARPGENELRVRAINYHWKYASVPGPEDNPAGVVFRLTMRVPPKPWKIRITADKDPFQTVDKIEVGESFSVELTYSSDPGLDQAPVALHTNSGGDLKTTAARLPPDGSPNISYRTGSIRLTPPP